MHIRCKGFSVYVKGTLDIGNFMLNLVGYNYPTAEKTTN